MRLRKLLIVIVIAIILSSCTPINSSQNLDEKIIELTFTPVDKETINVGMPSQEMTRVKTMNLQLYDEVKPSVHLYIQEHSLDTEEYFGEVYGFLEYEKVFYELGVLSNYGIQGVEIHTIDRTFDRRKEIEIIGGMGATYGEMKVITYDESLKGWINILTMGSPQLEDLDGDGTKELLAVSTGSLPGYLEIYRWDEDHFVKADIAEATNSNLAYTYLRNGKWVIETGILEGSEVKELKLYQYREGSLIEIKE